MSDDPGEAERTRRAYCRAWDMEKAFADEIADANRHEILRLATASTDPEDRRLLLCLGELTLTGGRDSRRIAEACREGRLQALVDRIEKEQSEANLQ
jgi:hypothetical protein